MQISRSSVTVVIPCFNQGRFLATAIRSVQRQSYKPLEIIVVDDGSSDDTAEVATAAATKLIRQPNLGVGAARNTGLKAATGEFVIFLDADDELLPDAIESGVAFLGARPQTSAVMRQCHSMDINGRTLPSEQPVVDTSDLYREWLSHNFAWTPGVAVFRRRAVLEIGGFPTDVNAAADYAVYLQLARRGGVAFDPRPVLRYRQHEGAMSGDPVLMLRATLEVLERERVHVPSNLMGAFAHGQRVWRKFYGEEIIERLRRDWRQGRCDRSHLQAVYVLIRQCPRPLVANLVRKVTRVLRGQPQEKLPTTATRHF
jgi:glycosyltransferase involved in cell wall biosynthesis